MSAYDKYLTTDEVIALLVRQCARIDNQAAWARANKMGASYVADVIHKRREPGRKILKALGLERVHMYRPTA